MVEQTYTESARGATVYSDDIATRSSYTVGNSLYGNVLGLTTMQKGTDNGEQITFYVHSWAKSLNGNNGILLVVDGLGVITLIKFYVILHRKRWSP